MVPTRVGLNDRQKAMLAEYIRRTNADLGPLFTQVGESDPEVFRALDMIAKGRAVLLQKSN